LWAGLVVGVVAGLPDIVMSGGLAIDGVLLFLVTAVAGFVGGWLGLRSSAAAPAMVEPVEVPPPQA
jgi:LytS/YehU family sensor histidine kinase